MIPFPTQFCRQDVSHRYTKTACYTRCFGGTHGDSCHCEEHKQAPPVSRSLDKVPEARLGVFLFELDGVANLVVFVQDELLLIVAVGVVLCEDLDGLFLLAVVDEPLGCVSSDANLHGYM